MKVMCKIKAFYKGSIVKVGQIIEITDKKCPPWAKQISGSVSSEKSELDKSGESNNPNHTENESTDNELEKKSDAELAKILDDLITKCCEKNLAPEGLEKLTVIEQIKTLQSELDKSGESK